jgi:hypothetical protein
VKHMSLLIPFIPEGIRCTMILRPLIGGTVRKEMLLSMLPFVTLVSESKQSINDLLDYYSRQVPKWKWEEIAMDFIVGLPRTQSGYDSIWVIVDRLTKVAHFIPVKTTYSGSQLAELYMSRIAFCMECQRRLSLIEGHNLL